MEQGRSTYYEAEGFVEYEIDIDHDDLVKAIEEYLWAHADFDFDECEIHSDRPLGISLTAKCHKYVDPDEDDPDVKANLETEEAYQDSDEFDGW